MTPRLLTIIILCLFSSCAGILNKATTKTVVHVNQPVQLVVNGDTLQTRQRTFNLTVDRSSGPLTLMAITDSQQSMAKVAPLNSFAWYTNIFCNYGIGMLIDKNGPRRYTYPRHIYLEMGNALRPYRAYRTDHRKGQLQLHISLPHVNNFHLRPEGETLKTNTGFWGFTIGLNYYHSNDQFLKLSTTGAMDLFIPVPAPVDIGGEHELMSSKYIALSNNHHWNRFILGYGLSFGRNVWDLRYYNRFDPPPPTRAPVKRRHDALGVLLSAHYMVGRNFNLGAVYRPTFLRFGVPEKFKYEHLISLDIAWKIILKR